MNENLKVELDELFTDVSDYVDHLFDYYEEPHQDLTIILGDDEAKAPDAPKTADVAAKMDQVMVNLLLGLNERIFEAREACVEIANEAVANGADENEMTALFDHVGEAMSAAFLEAFEV